MPSSVRHAEVDVTDASNDYLRMDKLLKFARLYHLGSMCRHPGRQHSQVAF